jgi:hypothetical protein
MPVTPEFCAGNTGWKSRFGGESKYRCVFRSGAMLFGRGSHGWLLRSILLAGFRLHRTTYIGAID